MGRFEEVNAPVLRHYAVAFRQIQEHSWPDAEVESSLSDETIGSLADDALVAHFAELLDRLRKRYPSIRVFWKDSNLDYVGSCEGFAKDSGVGTVEALIGLNDLSPQVAWIRQGAKYRRDDRAVMNSRAPKLDILERQDVEGAVLWLRTSKAPVLSEGKVIGMIGAYDIIDEAEAKHLGVGQL
ncbi:MAG: hypothetical protein R3B13_12860 [Polyangiaceae bacterium]